MVIATVVVVVVAVVLSISFVLFEGPLPHDVLEAKRLVMPPNLYHSLGRFSRYHDIYLIFSQTKGFDIPCKCLQPEMSKPIFREKK